MIDTRRDQLAALLKAGAPSAAVDAATKLLDDRERIEAARYREDRQREELAAADAATAAALREVMAAEDARIDRETATAHEAEDRERDARSREKRTLADVISLDRLRTTADPAEVRALVQDARRAGETLGAEATAIAVRRAGSLAWTNGVRPRARAGEPMEHRPAVGQAWFTLLCDLTAGHTGRTRAEGDLAARAESRKKQARQLVAAVGEVVGVRIAAPPRIAVPTAPAVKPTTTSFWDRFPQLMKRG